MRKLFGIFLTNLLLITLSLRAQTFPDITAEAFPANPQSGPHNYFGVRVILSQTYDHSITVTGYIFDMGNGPNTNHPFTLTIEPGNLTAETDVTFYKTEPAAIAVVEIGTVFSWPSDPGIYHHPPNTALKKVKTLKFEQPYALTIEKSWHFLEFSYYALGEYRKSLNLLGNLSCQ